MKKVGIMIIMSMRRRGVRVNRVMMRIMVMGKKEMNRAMMLIVTKKVKRGVMMRMGDEKGKQEYVAEQNANDEDKVAKEGEQSENDEDEAKED